jgi:hypothetical protein
MDNDWSLNIGGLILNFYLVLNHDDGDLGTTQRREFWEKDIHF